MGRKQEASDKIINGLRMSIAKVHCTLMLERSDPQHQEEVKQLETTIQDLEKQLEEAEVQVTALTESNVCESVTNGSERGKDAHLGARV